MTAEGYDAFVSYGHGDAEWVHALAGTGSGWGLRVFLDGPGAGGPGGGGGGEASRRQWALGLLAALIGGSAGLIPLSLLNQRAAARRRGGNPMPGFSLKVHIALVVFALSAGPGAVLLALGTASHAPAVAWLGVAVDRRPA